MSVTRPATVGVVSLGRLALFLAGLLLAGAGYAWQLKARVDAHEVDIKRIEASKASNESTDGQLKVVLTKIEEMDRRIGDRLDRIEAKQDAGAK